MSIKTLKSNTYSRSVMSGNSIILPGDYESIATTVVSGGSAPTSITFSSIPGTFKHLQIRAIGRNHSGYIRFNSDSASNYSRHWLRGNGATASAVGGSSVTEGYGFEFTGSGDLASTFGVGVIDILDYANTNKYKTVRSLSGADLNGSGNIYMFSTSWMSTSAITSITIYSPSSGAADGSHFALYGIRG